MDVKVVKKFMHKGFYCEITHVEPPRGMMDTLLAATLPDLPDSLAGGHYCGYVYLDKDHPMYGVNYDDANKNIGSCVNGGLTYSEQEGEQWCLGFDFGHCWNKDGGTVEDVEKDCKALCEQLEKVESFEVDLTNHYHSDKLPDAVVIKDTIYKHDDDVPDFISELKELCEKYNVDIKFNDISQYTYRSFHTEMNVSFISKVGVFDLKKIWGK